MPYKGINDPKLPSYVKNKSDSVRVRWVSIFNDFYKKQGESMAFRMANSWMTKHLRRKKKELIAKSKEATELINLKFNISQEELVIRTEGDEEFIEAVLTDDEFDSHGTAVDSDFLEELANQINENGIVGDFDHSQMKQAINMGLDNATIVNFMKEKKGVAKAIKAFVKKGKLFIRAIIDKRYKKRILNSKGLSIEGLFTRDKQTNKLKNGTVFGFTFGEKDTPSNSRAKITDWK